MKKNERLNLCVKSGALIFFLLVQYWTHSEALSHLQVIYNYTFMYIKVTANCWKELKHYCGLNEQSSLACSFVTGGLAIFFSHKYHVVIRRFLP